MIKRRVNSTELFCIVKKQVVQWWWLAHLPIFNNKTHYFEDNMTTNYRWNENQSAAAPLQPYSVVQPSRYRAGIFPTTNCHYIRQLLQSVYQRPRYTVTINGNYYTPRSLQSVKHLQCITSPPALLYSTRTHTLSKPGATRPGAKNGC